MGENGNYGRSLRFDEFELDLAKRRLLRFEEVVPLKPKAFDLLAVLVENNGRLLTKDDLFQLVWANQFVDETNLTVGISAIRRALGEKAAEPRFITNVSGRGYYFNAEVHENGHFKSAVHIQRDLPSSDISEPDPAAAGKQPRRRIHLNRYLAIAALLVIVISAVGLYFYYFRTGSSGASQFGSLAVRRLTTTGRATTAAISPDGKLFAFVRQEPDGGNSLWLGQVEGGEQIQLRAPGAKPLVSVTFGPDASRVYFVEAESNDPEQGVVFRVPSLGGVVEKVREGVPARISFSPDGKNFAFVRRDKANDRSRLMISAADGADERELAAAQGIGAFSYWIDWSPDGKFIALPVVLRDKSPAQCEIFAVSVADGSLSQVTNHGWESIRSLVWTRSSDGFLAVGAEGPELERQIWHVRFPGGNMEKLLADSNAYSALSLSVDDSAILGIQTQSISSIWVAPASDLSAAKQVTFDMLGKQSGWTGLDWTNDGRLVYASRTSKSDTLWEVKADGTEQRQVIPDSKRAESVSLPDDGSFMVFTANRSDELEIVRTNRDGTDLVQLTSGGNHENPHVSPDGRYIVYKAGTGSEVRLMRISSSGGEPLRLTDAVADWARFSPDSKQIACGYEVNGKMKLAILSPEGGPPLKLFEVPASANFRLGVRWTPDGKAVTYRDWQNGIWKQQLDGGEPVRLAGLPAEKLFAYAWSRDGKLFAYARGSAISDVVLMSSLK